MRGARNWQWMLLGFGVLHASLGLAAPEPECGPRETVLLVKTHAHELLLCDRGSLAARYPVALGSGGIGKRRQGDAKTPVGSYRLGAPRASQSFHTFIPVGYPTPSERQKGWTGSAVGIHGPPREARLLGEATVKIDWTLGCIAVSSDAIIDEVAGFVRKHADIQIRLVEDPK